MKQQKIGVLGTAMLAGTLLLGTACASDGASIGFTCGQEMPMRISLQADGKGRIVFDQLPDQPGCNIRLEEVEGDIDEHVDGSRVQFDISRGACDSAQVRALLIEEIYVHVFDFWKAEATHQVLYAYHKPPADCQAYQIDWDVAGTFIKSQ